MEKYLFHMYFLLDLLQFTFIFTPYSFLRRSLIDVMVLRVFEARRIGWVPYVPADLIRASFSFLSLH